MNEIIDAGRAAYYAFQMVRHGNVKALAASLVPIWESNQPQEPQVDFQSLAIIGYSRNPIVYACVQALARSSAEAPAKIMQRLPTGVWEEDFNHPLRQLLQFPNEFESGFELIEDIITHLFIAGNAYLEKERANGGQVVGLHPLMPDRVRVIPGQTFIRGYEYTVGNDTVTLPREDIIHFKLPNPINRYYGLAPLAVLARVVDADNSTIDWVRLFFENSAVPMGILKTKHRVDEVEANRIKERWREKFVGNWHDVSVLDSDADFMKIGIGLDDLDVTALTNMSESRICAVFGVPPILIGVKVGLERATFCLPADSQVWVPEGRKNISDVKAGDVVWSFVDGKLQQRKVLRSAKTGHKLLYEIKTKNKTLRATGNHPVLVRIPGTMGGGGNATRHPSYGWKRVDELTLDDKVVQPMSLPDLGQDILPDGTIATPELMQFLGAFIGDGNLSEGWGVRMAMPENDRCGNHYRLLAQKLFTKQIGGNGKGDQSVLEREPVVIQEKERSFEFCTAADSWWLGDLGFNHTAHTKRIPGWVFKLSKPLRLHFLAGLVDSDGYIEKRGYLSFGMCNKELVEDIRHLALGLGFRCTNLDYRQVHADQLPNPGRKEYYDSWRIVISSALMVSQIPFVDPLYRERVDANADKHQKEGMDAWKANLASNLGFYSIVSIRELHAEDVYDIEVEDGHSFIADGIVVHNSNAREAKRSFWDETLIPLYKRIEMRLNLALADDFNLSATSMVRTDFSDVRALQEDEDQLWLRAARGLRTGGITINDFRRMVNMQAVPNGDVILIPANTIPVDLDGNPVFFEPPNIGVTDEKSLLDDEIEQLFSSNGSTQHEYGV